MIRQIKNNVMGLQALGNPTAAFNYLAQNNPNIQKAAQFIQQTGGNPKTAMEMMARERGIDPNEIYAALK